jgi:hypothetical protein
MRETIVWVLFCVMLTLAAFGWGWIYRDRQIDVIYEKVHKIEKNQGDLHGRVIGLETAYRRAK